MKKILLFFIMIASEISFAQSDELMVRIAEIEIDSYYLEDYKKILQEESYASIKLELGVIAIYPMYQKEKPTQIRILEIYQNRKAYESHLKTPHFLKYKTSTSKMVKSLRIIEMGTIDSNSLAGIFRKIKG
jgi:quinol monooxygenase YgiN